MTRIDSPYGFVMYPVTSTVLNKEGQSDYANGFTPEYIISELNYYPWYELGDPNELLLKNALQWMAGGVPSDAENVSKPEEPETPESPASLRLPRKPVILPSSAKKPRRQSCPNKILYIKKTNR